MELARAHHDLHVVDRTHYQLGPEIARGGMGRILAAHDRRLGRPVAIKELLVDSPDLRARFEREARITAKLQHPSIVSIHEAGAWPTGEAFYVMKLVAGESLDKVIAVRTTLDARLALLPHVIAAVDALAYAHAHRVIHRDLKPANVLVGAYGETVVIDWGLAKDLADTSDFEDRAAGPYRTPADAVGQTVAGAVMGTPAYMPAEQALGESLDERADVYSLGALLYHVLTGEPPFTGTSVESILAQVITEPVVPIDRRLPAVPRDLATIVGKALAKERADRYADAGAFAEDLKRFQTGQLVAAHRYTRSELVQRWLKRHRTPMIVASVFVTIIVAMATLSIRQIVDERDMSEQQRTVAVLARQEAEQQRAAGQQLIDYMLVQLKKQLAPIGKLVLLESIADSVSIYYASTGHDDGKIVDLRNRAATFVLLGDVESGRQQATAALAAYDRAQALLERALVSAPQDPELDAELVRTHQGRGDVLLFKGQLKPAKAQYHAAEALIRSHLATDPVSRRWKAALGLVDAKLGMQAANALDNERALHYQRDRVRLGREVASQSPDDESVFELARALSSNGGLESSIGNVGGAIPLLEEAITLLGRLATTHPGNTMYAERLGEANSNLGMAYSIAGKLDRSTAALQLALQARRLLAERDPENARWALDVPTTQLALAEVVMQRGRYAETATLMQEIQAAFDALIAKYPGDLKFAMYRAASASTLAVARNKLGDRAGAITAFRDGVVRWRAAYPGGVGGNDYVAAYLEQIGQLETERGSIDAARAAYAEATEAATALVASDPANPGFQGHLAQALEYQGDFAQARGDRAAALAHYRKEYDLLLPHANGARVDLAMGLALLTGKLARLLDSDSHAEAMRLVDTGIAIAKRIAANGVVRPEDAKGLADLESWARRHR